MRTRRLILSGLALALCLLAPQVAQAASKPSADTDGVKNVTMNSVVLYGHVNPRGLSTQYGFEYGVNGKLTATSPLAAIDGSKSQSVHTALGSLSPFTKYTYRTVAVSSAGVAHGPKRTFTTRKQPLGLSLGATPNPVPYGSPVTLTGTLAGTGNAGKTVVINQNPFPFTAGLQPFGNPIVTDKSGNFSVAVLSLPATTQYQAVVQDTKVASPIFTLSAAVKVSTTPSKTRIKRGHKLRLSGSSRPARDGLQVSVQKKSPSGKWVTVATTTTRHKDSTRSVYGRSLTISRGGTYRTSIATQGDLATGVGPEIKISSYR